MGLVIAPQFTQRTYRWTEWKATQASKSLIYQHLDDGVTHTIWGYDGPEVHICTIWKSEVPYTLIAVYTQVQNDADKSDFETNYLAGANHTINPPAVPSVVDGYTTTSSTSFTAVMGTLYTEQASGARRSLVSTSANDSAAGTGARKIRVRYFKSDLSGPFEEDVTLNGTTPVDMTVGAIDARFFDSLKVIEAGSLLANVGTINLKAAVTGGGVTVGSIAPSDNETNWCHRYIPSVRALKIFDFGGHVRGIYGGALHLRASKPITSNSVEETIAPVLRTEPGKNNIREFIRPITVEGPARVVLYAKADNAASMDWLAGFNFFEEEA